MPIFIDALVKSLHNLKKHWHLLFLAGLFDLLFFVFFGFSNAFLKVFINQPLTALVQEAGKSSIIISQAIAQGKDALQALLENAVISQSIHSLLGFIVIFIGILYLLWVVFNGANWFLAHKIADEKRFTFLTYFKKFAIISLAWFAILATITGILTRFALFALLRPEQILSSDIIVLIGNILYPIAFYFIFISLALIAYTTPKENFKKTFLYGLKEAPTFLVVFAIIALAFYLNFQITFFIFQGLEQTAPILGIILRFLLAVPVLTWARTYLMLTAKEIN